MSTTIENDEKTATPATENSEPNLELNLEPDSENSEPENELHTASPLENSETEPASDYQPDNAAFDELIAEATTTQADAQSQERTETRLDAGRPVNPLAIKPEDAIGMAAFGISQITAFCSDKSGNDLNLPAGAVGMLSAFCAPLIQKYGPAIKKYMAQDDVDTDSYMPELFAGGSAVAIGGWMLYQHKSQNKKTKAVEVDD